MFVGFARNQLHLMFSLVWLLQGVFQFHLQNDWLKFLLMFRVANTSSTRLSKNFIDVPCCDDKLFHFFLKS